MKSRLRDFTVDGAPAGRAFLADSYFLRLRGLIGRDVESLGGLLLKPCSSVHTCFMSCPIDVVYLSKENAVLRVDPAVPAWKFPKGARGAKNVLELPAGRAAALGIKEGNVLIIQ